MGAGEEGPAAAAGWRRQQPQKSAQKQSKSMDSKYAVLFTNLSFELFPRRVRDREPPCPGAGGQEGAAGGPGQGQE